MMSEHGGILIRNLTNSASKVEKLSMAKRRLLVIEDSIVYSQSHSTGFVEEGYGICGIAKMARNGGILFPLKPNIVVMDIFVLVMDSLRMPSLSQRFPPYHSLELIIAWLGKGMYSPSRMYLVESACKKIQIFRRGIAHARA